MDKNITLYQITNVMAEKVFQKIDHFNKGRREDTGYYAISVSTPYRSYYALWRIFPDNSHSPLFVRTQAERRLLLQYRFSAAGRPKG